MLEWFCFIGIPLIVVVAQAIFIVVPLKRKRKKIERSRQPFGNLLAKYRVVVGMRCRHCSFVWLKSLSRFKKKKKKVLPFMWVWSCYSITSDFSMERCRVWLTFLCTFDEYFGVWMNNKMIERRCKSDWMHLSRYDAIVVLLGLDNKKKNMTKCLSD